MENYKKFGFEKSNVSAFLLGCDLNQIHEKVILAPCWTPLSVGITEAKLIYNSTHQVWDCSMNDKLFSYIVSGVGAGVCSDLVMSLGDTACSKILFMGSAGSIAEHIQVGDIVVPECIICGDGLCRYLSTDVRIDCFGEPCLPDNAVRRSILTAAKEQIAKYSGYGISCHTGTGATVETIFSQFMHLDTFREMSCGFLDMESAACLKAAKNIGIGAAVIFCISDNSICQQSLITISDQLTRFRKEVRRKVMPGVITAFLAM